MEEEDDGGCAGVCGEDNGNEDNDDDNLQSEFSGLN